MITNNTIQLKQCAHLYIFIVIKTSQCITFCFPVRLLD